MHTAAKIPVPRSGSEAAGGSQGCSGRVPAGSAPHLPQPVPEKSAPEGKEIWVVPKQPESERARCWTGQRTGLCSHTAVSQQHGVKPYPSTEIPALHAALLRGTLRPQARSPAAAPIIPVPLTGSAGAGPHLDARRIIYRYLWQQSLLVASRHGSVRCAASLKQHFMTNISAGLKENLSKPLALTRSCSPD